MGINEPYQINEEKIAYELEINLTYSNKRSYSYQYNDYKAINIYSNLSVRERRERFFHELAHLLRHQGWQLELPKSFIEWQELDSLRFTSYATLPHFMLLKYDLDFPFIVNNLINDFHASKEICTKRINQIKKNTNIFDNHFYRK